MAKHLVIYAQPNIVFYDTTQPATPEFAFESLISITDIITELSQSGGEVANITVNIDNVNGELTRYFDGWFGTIAEYWKDGKKIFSGTVSTIQSSATLQLTIIA